MPPSFFYSLVSPLVILDKMQYGEKSHKKFGVKRLPHTHRHVIRVIRCEKIFVSFVQFVVNFFVFSRLEFQTKK